MEAIGDVKIMLSFEKKLVHVWIWCCKFENEDCYRDKAFLRKKVCEKSINSVYLQVSVSWGH